MVEWIAAGKSEVDNIVVEVSRNHATYTAPRNQRRRNAAGPGTALLGQLIFRGRRFSNPIH